MQAAMESYKLWLGNDTFQYYISVHNIPYTGNIDGDGFMQYQQPFQNLLQHTQVSLLPNFTSFGLKAPDDGDPVSFCMDEVMLLPSTMVGRKLNNHVLTDVWHAWHPNVCHACSSSEAGCCTCKDCASWNGITCNMLHLHSHGTLHFH